MGLDSFLSRPDRLATFRADAGHVARQIVIALPASVRRPSLRPQEDKAEQGEGERNPETLESRSLDSYHGSMFVWIRAIREMSGKIES